MSIPYRRIRYMSRYEIEAFETVVRMLMDSPSLDYR